jgi:septal ring factor EnvC (AmiA/AmiB activator)
MTQIEYIFGGQLQRDIQQILASQAAMQTQITQGIKTMTNNLDQVLSNEQAESAAIKAETTEITTLTATIAQTNKDLQAVITNLQASGTDTTDLQAILDSQTASLADEQANAAALANLNTTEANADPNAAVTPTPGTTAAPPVVQPTVSTETTHRGSPVDPINPAAV